MHALLSEEQRFVDPITHVEAEIFSIVLELLRERLFFGAIRVHFRRDSGQAFIRSSKP
jgi:hypothetical protein